MSKVRKLLVGGAATALAVTALSAAAPAAADNVGGGTDAQGPYVMAQVSFTGDIVAGGGGGRIPIPATCWWEPVDVNIGLGDPPVDPEDPASVQAYFESIIPLLSGHAAGARLEIPDGRYMQDIARRVAAGEELTFYHAECVDGKNPVDEGLIESAGRWQGIDFGVMFRAFPPGNPAPPVVAAETLAEFARERLLVENPEVDRNPKIGLGGTQAALVTLPTYFWVTNVDGALGDDPVGTKRVTATAGNAVARLTAEATGISISAPAGALENGGRECDAETITRPYSAGAAEGDLCSVKFSRASVGQGAGWPVTVASHWDVSWEGNQENGDPAGGDLNLLNPTQSDINVPVAESQAVVDSTNG